MNILIVEDEKPAAERIFRLLNKINIETYIVASLETVEGTINWLQNNPAPDLIVMDIQLDDGLCFEIFETIKIDTPVIFTTAYDEYAIQAFKVNSVDYLLKPIEEEALLFSLNKFKEVHYRKKLESPDFHILFKEFTNHYKTRFLVKIGIRYISIPVHEISYFYLMENSTFIKCFNGRNYAIEFSLEQLLKIVDPSKFFRINRNYIINIDAINEMLSYSSSRLLVKLSNVEPSDDFVVSRDKVSKFKKWIDK
jgi:DNA-binding LytR/AlgR family response regulator